jgi:hypothetical protein
MNRFYIEDEDIDLLMDLGIYIDDKEVRLY